MNQGRAPEAVAVMGASPKADRYSHKAMEMLREYGHRALPINPAFKEILGETCYPNISAAPRPIDTVTIYLREERSTPLIEEIIKANPRRIILNPGAENPFLLARAEET